MAIGDQRQAADPWADNRHSRNGQTITTPRLL